MTCVDCGNSSDRAEPNCAAWIHVHGLEYRTHSKKCLFFLGPAGGGSAVVLPTLRLRRPRIPGLPELLPRSGTVLPRVERRTSALLVRSLLGAFPAQALRHRGGWRGA